TSATAVTSDELITLQAQIKQAYQANACWTMNTATFTAIKKLKDSDGKYLLQNDLSEGFPYRLLGKPVYISDNMPAMAAGAKAILYGDYSGLSVNMRENISIEVLREKYATQHAIGVNALFEFDSKVADSQKLAVLTMKAS
ncbi:MAG: phage major capsid protein, partial [Oscillospiraceae bacterium]|nr:phage major capsid protein [Oscillospiraceae bacterium]